MSAALETENSARHEIVADENAAGLRLDKFIAEHGPDLSRMRAKALILDGCVLGDGKTITDASYRVKPGLTIIISVPQAVAAAPVGQDIPLQIVFEDEHLIVIDKAVGLVVHPGAGNYDQTLVNALIHHCGDSLSGIGGVKRPGIVHRLDKDTSGLMVAAKSDAAHAGLARQFEQHTLERAYKAVVWGAPTPPEGKIEGNIGRSPRNRKKMAVVGLGPGAGGKTAVTHYRLLRRLGGSHGAIASLVECRLETGRTHQIRVHMTHIGHPVVGDPAYGRRRRAHVLTAAGREAVAALSRQALHACTIGFRHPLTGDDLRFDSQIPADMENLIDALQG
jgi:23S rRNA pseudouridine1911/1915/1917 synthase